jgi:hypothetical protein
MPARKTRNLRSRARHAGCAHAPKPSESSPSVASRPAPPRPAVQRMPFTEQSCSVSPFPAAHPLFSQRVLFSQQRSASLFPAAPVFPQRIPFSNHTSPFPAAYPAVRPSPAARPLLPQRVPFSLIASLSHNVSPIPGARPLFRAQRVPPPAARSPQPLLSARVPAFSSTTSRNR